MFLDLAAARQKEPKARNFVGPSAWGFRIYGFSGLGIQGFGGLRVQDLWV